MSAIPKPDSPRQTVDCPWCGVRDRWPDGCHEGDDFCVEEVAFRHALNDHRQCDEASCGWASYWNPRVLSVALQACEVADLSFAAVSTIDWSEPIVIGTYARLQNAKPARTRYGEARGLSRAEVHGLVPVVRRDGVYV